MLDTYPWKDTPSQTALAPLPGQLNVIQFPYFAHEDKNEVDKVAKRLAKQGFEVKVEQLSFSTLQTPSAVYQEASELPESEQISKWCVVLTVKKLGDPFGNIKNLKLKHRGTLSVMDFLGICVIWTGCGFVIYNLQADLISLLAACFAYYLTKFIILKKE